MEKGVKVDTHPPGVQVFMNYWRLAFGDSPWIMKLPFTLMGLGAIYLIWKLGKLWYNETVALVSASFMATLQFTIMYSQIARPYISGLFLTLLMVWYWSKLVKKPNNHFWINGVGLVLAGSLCAYNHHFSLLFAAVVGLSGLFFIHRKHLLKYAGSGLGIFILYLPNLPLFFAQLDQGGVGTWLAPPTDDFLWQFIRYVFHYSWVLLSVAILILLSSFYFKSESFSRKNFMLFLSWFMIPFLIGFFYSRYKNPVLQYSVLLFSFPYLFFLIFGKLKELNPKFNLIICGLIISLSIATLNINRQHYKLFYNSPYKEILKDQNEAYKKDNSTLRIIDSYPKLNRFYNKSLSIDTNYVWAQELGNEIGLKRFLDQNYREHDKLHFGAYSMTNHSFFPIIMEFFPTLEKTTNYEGGSSWLFSKIGTFGDTKSENQLVSKSDTISALWSAPNSFSEKYSQVYSLELDRLKLDKNDFIDISVDVKLPEGNQDISIASDITSDGELLHWSANKVEKFELNEAQWNKAHHSISLAVLNLDLEDAELKTYLLNNSGTEVMFKNFKATVRKGNPYLYGLYEEIE